MNWSPSKSSRSSLTRLWRLKPSTKLCNDFYVLDIETAHRPKGNKVFTKQNSSKDYKGVLKWQLKATNESFIFGVLYGYNYCKVIHSIEEFKETLLEPRFKDKYIYAHNGGNFDYISIYGIPYDTDPEALYNGKFICFTNGNCIFADSTNIFIGMSIETIGKMIGKDKQGMTDNYKDSVWPKDYSFDVNGCIIDCEILWDALFQTFEFAGEIRITQASLSMCYFRRFHQPFHIDHNENTKHFWKSYYGGRTEVFKLGKTHASCIDINSSYPYQTKTGVFPNPKTLKHELNFPVKKLAKYLEWFEGMIDATVIHRDTKDLFKPNGIGFLPVKKDNKLIFPTGKIRGQWNFPEIRFALKHGVIEIAQIHSIVYGEKMVSPFESMIDTLFEIKAKAVLDGDKMLESMTKYYMNMFYGKFGQRNIEQSIYIKDIEKQFHIIQEYQKKKQFLKLVPFGKKRNDAMLIIGKRNSKPPAYAIPSFASYITTYGRVQLLEKMLEFSNRKVVYCDTDSVFFEIAGDINSEKQLGGWKLENKIITDIKGLKNYKYIDDIKKIEVWRVKGVPVNKGRKVKIFDGDKTEEFNSVEQIGENKFRYFNLMKSKEALRRNKEAGILTERIKEIKNTYDKRLILTNGETKPIKL